MPVFIVDPCQAGRTPLRTVTIIRGGQDLTASPQSDLAATYTAGLITYPADNAGGQTFQLTTRFHVFGVRQVSAANATNVVTLTTENLNQILSIAMVASAGTATLQVAVSTDNINFLNLEAPIAAAAATYKTYDPTTRGGTNALSPLAFRFVKITAGSAGVGNTTQLDIGMK